MRMFPRNQLTHRASSDTTEDGTDTEFDLLEMGESSRSRRSSFSSLATSSRRGTWLPPQRPQLLLSQPLNARYIAENRANDWFLALASEVNERDPQGRMLAKTYLFFRDFMPKGLTGEFGHLSGNKVMDYLLSHPGESAVSRHRLSRDAEVSFDELGKWMKNGTNWEEALRQSGADGGGFTGRGLYDPEALLAVLVLAYPDMKLQDRIRKLQIDWMLRPRATLAVNEGFWKGINAGNVWNVFKQSRQHKPQCKLLLDYDTLFGEKFISCRRAIRPFLPADLQDLKLDGGPDLDDLEDLADNSQDLGALGHTEAQTDVGTPIRLSRASSPGPPSTTTLEEQYEFFLLPPPAQHPSELEEWLTSKVVGGHVVYGVWCAFWEHRMRKAESYQEQRIIRSLFLQSLCRLHQLSSMPAVEFNPAEAYALLDWGDGLSTEADEDKYQGQRARLEQIHHFSAWDDVCTRFLRAHSDEASKDLLERLITRQKRFFLRLLSDPSLESHAPDALAFDRLRMELLVRKLGNPAGPGPAGGELLGATTRSTLQLTGWQARCLIGGAGSPAVLTDFQLQLFRQEPLPDGMHWVDLSRVLPVHPQRADADTLDDRGNQILRQLFGDLQYHPRPATPVVLPRTSPPAPMSTPLRGTLAAAFSRAHAVIGTPDDTANGVRRGSETPMKPSAGKFAQFARFTAKRQLTPEQRGSDKKPRLGYLTRDECREDIKAEVEELRTALANQGATLEERYQSLTRTTETLQASLNDAVADRKRLRPEIRDDLSGALGTGFERFLKDLKADLTPELVGEAGRLSAQLVQDLTTAFRTELAGCREQSRADLSAVCEDLRNVTRGVTSVDTTLEQVKSKVQAQMDMSTRQPELGEPDGYLAKNCPAPGGVDQKVYVARLLRAAWGYMNQRGDPDEGVDIDASTIERVDEKFPGLQEDHVMEALRHVHVQAYHRPFPL